MITGLVDTLIRFLPADMQAKAKETRKALVAGIGALLTALTLLSKFKFLIPAAYEKQIATAIAILTAINVYLAPNDTPSTA